MRSQATRVDPKKAEKREIAGCLLVAILVIACAGYIVVGLPYFPGL